MTGKLRTHEKPEYEIYLANPNIHAVTWPDGAACVVSGPFFEASAIGEAYADRRAVHALRERLRHVTESIEELEREMHKALAEVLP